MKDTLASNTPPPFEKKYSRYISDHGICLLKCHLFITKADSCLKYPFSKNAQS